MAETMGEDLVAWLKSQVPKLAEQLVFVDGKPIELEREWQHRLVGSTSIYEVWNKARQIGFSYGAALRTMLRAHLFPPGSYNAVFVSINREEAREKIRYIEMLLSFMKGAKKCSISNKMQIEFENGNTIRSFPSRPVRGLANVDLYLDEFAHIKEAREIYQGSTASTVRQGYGIAVGSTPYGRGAFYDICHGAGQPGEYKLFQKFEVPWWESHILCKDPYEARVFAPGMRTSERVAVYGRPNLIREYENLSLESFQQEYECFPPGTDIITIDGVKSIEDIRKGDVVLTHTGRWRKVTAVMSRHYKGPMTVLRTYGNSKPLVSTPNHPVYSQQYTDSTRGNLGVKVKYDWVRADLLRGSMQNEYHADRVVFPKLNLSRKKPLISGELACLIAWYIAEGSSTRNLLQFSLGAHEEEYVLDVLRCLKVLSSSKPTVAYKDGSAIITIGDTQLALLLSNECGSGAHNKRIPFYLIAGHEKLVYSTLVKGDGCSYSTSHREMDSYGTVSNTLAYQVQLLAHTLGYTSGITEVPPATDEIKGRRVGGSGSFSIQINKTRGAQTKKKLRSHKTAISASVMNTETIQYDGTVYNLEVEVDHSYTANGRAVHNCFFLDYGSSALSQDLIMSCANGTIDCEILELDCGDNTVDVMEQVHILLQKVTALGGKLHDVFMGYDVGRQVHASELIMLDHANNKLTTRMYLTMRRCPYPKQDEVLRYIFNNTPMRRAVIDSQGIGNQLAQGLQDTYTTRVEPMNFGEVTKAEMVGFLIKAFEEQSLCFYPTMRMCRQLLEVKKVYSSNGRILYRSGVSKEEGPGGEDQKSHADLFWSLAMAVTGAGRFLKVKEIKTTKRSPILHGYGGHGIVLPKPPRSMKRRF